jgi:hypothetical protein
VIFLILGFMAEREGFEPSRQFVTTYTLSKRAPSTAQPSLHKQNNKLILTYIKNKFKKQ